MLIQVFSEVFKRLVAQFATNGCFSRGLLKGFQGFSLRVWFLSQEVFESVRKRIQEQGGSKRLLISL